MSTFDARSLNLGVETAEIRPLLQTKPYVHFAWIVINWALIIATAVLTWQYLHPLTYMLAVTIIGARMHALAILMHDASHFRFLKNRKANDLLTNLLTMYPIYTSIEKYRANHFKHHRHLNTEDDPDWFAKLGQPAFTFPKSKQEFVLTVLSYFFMIRGVKDAIWFVKRFAGPAKNTGAKSEKPWGQLAFYAVMVVLLTYFGLWLPYLIFWVIPYFSTFFMFQYVRSVAEHFGELAYDHLLTSTRTIKVYGIEKFFFAPHNVGFHLEHHLYPGVPFYHLPKLHQLLMSKAEYAHKAHITYGYVGGLLNELGKLTSPSQPAMS
ncbi:MAG: fatty acid desaturase family protein [Bacteroidota bacterium]